MTGGLGWYDVLGGPVFNHLLVPLSNILLGYFGLGIIVFTLVVRFVLLPITIKQFRGSREMQRKMRAIKPELKGLQHEYKGNRKKQAQETLKIYREAGISPLGCLTSPMMMSVVVQMPILVAMIAAVRYASKIPDNGGSEGMIRVLQEGLSPQFLWLNLTENDSTFIMPILVALTMFVSQMLMTPSADEGLVAQLTRIATILMGPLMFLWLCAVNPSGLALYWLTSMLVNLGIQYYVWSDKQPDSGLVKDTESSVFRN